jgi:hypothetical protein
MGLEWINAKTWHNERLWTKYKESRANMSYEEWVAAIVKNHPNILTEGEMKVAKNILKEE